MCWSAQAIRDRKEAFPLQRDLTTRFGTGTTKRFAGDSRAYVSAYTERRNVTVPLKLLSAMSPSGCSSVISPSCSSPAISDDS